LLANRPKYNRLSPVEPGALYYFPEIPCRAENDGTALSKPGHFVGGTPDQKDGPSEARIALNDSNQVQCLIEEAFEKGMHKGRAEAIAAQQEKIDQAAAALTDAVDALIRIRQQDHVQMQRETVRLALSIAKKVIRHECEHGQIVTQVVKAALKKVTDPRQLTIKLNPRDMQAVGANQDALMIGDDTHDGLRLEEDETILPGGCLIETQLGDVDARIDRQIKIIEEMLTDQLPKPVIDG
jgi:flagellar biosynthesis/type III secretory pathway protein FliH